jgi:hypothetical protein
MAVNQINTQTATGAGAGGPFNVQEWASEMETQARDFRITAPLIRTMTFKGPADKLNIPKLGAITAAAFTTAMEQADASSIVYSMPNNTLVTITPGVSYAATRVSQRELDHANYDLEGALQDELGEALAQYEDSTLCQFFHDASFNNTDLGASGTNYTEALLFSQIQSLITASKSKSKIGPGGNVSLIYHSAQINDLWPIASITSGAITLKENGPQATGIIKGGWGVNFGMSDNVTVVAGDCYCPCFSKEAMVMARLYKPKFRAQWDQDNLGYKLAAWQEFGQIALNITAVVEALVLKT